MATLIIVTLWTAAVVLAGLAYRVGRQSKLAKPTSYSVVALLLGAIWWILAYLLEINLTDPTLKYWAYRAKFPGIITTAVAWFVFAVYYTGRERWLSRRHYAILLLIPAITLILIATNESHRLMWTESTPVDAGGFGVYVSTLASWFWVHTLYCYITLTTGTVLLFRRFTETTGQYQQQIGTLLISVIFPYVSAAVSIFGPTVLDLAPLAFTITGVSLGWGYLRYHLFDLIPFAQATVIAGMPDGMVVLDKNERIIELNPTAATLFGNSADALLGTPLVQAFPALHHYPDLIEGYRAERTVTGEVVMENGAEPRYLDLRLSPLHDTQGKVSGYVMVLHDISTRKQAEEQIREQNNALVRSNQELVVARQKAEEATHLKSQFLATMSHELRTPLNAIIGYTEIQLEGMTGDLTQEQQEYQQRVLINAEHLLGLINGVLDVSKIEAGQMTLVSKPFRLGAWVQELERQNRGLAEAKGLTFEVNIDPRLPDTLEGDGIRLKQIAINLVGNAIKFTDSGEVRLEVLRHDDSHWKMVVSDSGIGIARHAQDAIFDEFWQVDRTSRRHHGGTGLGLSIVRRLVLLMGGTIHVKSEPGNGSTFTVLLPLHPHHEAEPIPA